MLKILRRKDVSKKIFYVLAALIIPAFIAWGTMGKDDKEGGPRGNVAGRIFDQAVGLDDFRIALNAWKTQLALQYGDKANEAAQMMDPIQGTWDRLIMLHEAKRRWIKVTDKEVVEAITRFPFLQRNGVFDPKAYQLFVQYSLGMPSARLFENQLRDNLAMAKVFKDMTKDVTVTDEEVRAEYEKVSVTTQVRYAAFLYAPYKEGVAATEDEIKKFYETSKEALKIPPQISVAWLGVEFEKMPGVTKAQAEEKITTAMKSSRTKGLAEAGKEVGLEVQESGYFGYEDPLPNFGWLPQLSTILFDLPVRGFSKLIEMKRGVFFFQILDKKDAYIPEMKDAIEKIKLLIIEQKAKEIAQNKAKAFLDVIKVQGKTFAEALQGQGLESKETPEFTRESYIPELGLAEPLKEASFNLQADAVASDPIALEQGLYVIQSMKTPALDEEKFKKDKDAAHEAVLDKKRSEAFDAYFKNLKGQARLTSFVDEGMFR
jgi:hypothetical protein